MTKKACLLLHGFGGSTFELKELNNALKQANIFTNLPLLAGHGTTLQEFAQQRYENWYEQAEKEFLKLKENFEQVFVLGFSMGGTLTLDLSRKHSFTAMIIIAAPVFLTRIFPPLVSDWRLFLVPFLKHIKPIYPTGKPDPRSRKIAPWKGYEGYIPLFTLHSFLKNMKKVKKDLTKITTPFLSIYATTDKTVPIENAYYILKKTSSAQKELLLLKIEENITSNHLLPTHQETKEKVIKKVKEYILSF